MTRAVSKHVANDGVHKWQWRIGTPKSEKSNRRVALPESVIRLLSSLRGDSDNLEAFIFGTAEDQFMTPDHFDEFVFKPVATHAGLIGVRFHDLRHFFASMLIAQGENAKYICDQMGHSSIQVTFDTSGHLFPQAREEAARRLEAAMFAGRKRPSGRALVDETAKSNPNTQTGSPPN